MRSKRVLIVDDEIHAQQILAHFVTGYSDQLRIVGKCNNLLDAVDFIKTKPVDIVFLDVEMPVHQGTKITEFLSKEERPDIIFVTAYKSFAIDAIRLGAFDYVLKPLDKSELYTCLDRYFSEKQKEAQNLRKKLTISTHKEQILLDFEEIIFLSANGSYTEILTTKKKLTASKPIKHFEQNLTKQFVRVHRSHIVNKDKVEKIEKKENNWWISFADSDLNIPISRKYKEQLNELI